MSETVIGVKKYIQFELVSPERILASEEASMVVIPGGDGDFGVLADHTPLVSTIRPGIVSVYTPSGEVKKIFVSGGFADVDGKICSVLAEEAVNVTDINRADVEQKIKDLAAELADSGHDAVKKNNLLRNIAIADAKLAAAA
jgi:F-type H+-transporting ATPase subunit epsilon